MSDCELTSVARSERRLPPEIRDAIENSYRSYVEGSTFNLDDVDLMRANLAQNRNASWPLCIPRVLAISLSSNF